MPTIITHGRFRIKVHGPPREHPPPHVHVLLGREATAVITIPVDGARARVRAAAGMTLGELHEARQLIERYARLLSKAWEGMHG